MRALFSVAHCKAKILKPSKMPCLFSNRGWQSIEYLRNFLKAVDEEEGCPQIADFRKQT